jgi:hypothetical protein
MAQITTYVGSPGTIGAASGGRTYAYNNLSTGPQVVAPLNPQRQSITIHNPGSIDAFIAPSAVQNTGQDVPLVPSPTSLGGCYRVYANGGTLVISGECQKSWQAFSASGSDNPLTVTDSTI